MGLCKVCGERSRKDCCLPKTSSPQPEPARPVPPASETTHTASRKAALPKNVGAKTTSTSTATTKKAAGSSSKAGTGIQAQSSKAAGQATGVQSGASDAQAQSSDASQRSTASGGTSQVASTVLVGKGKAAMTSYIGLGTGVQATTAQKQADSKAASLKSVESTKSMPAQIVKADENEIAAQKEADLEADSEAASLKSVDSTESMPAQIRKADGKKVTDLPLDILSLVLQEFEGLAEPNRLQTSCNMSLSSRDFYSLAVDSLYVRYKHYSYLFSGPFIRTLIDNPDIASKVRETGYGDLIDRNPRNPSQMSSQDARTLEKAALNTRSHLKKQWVQDLRLNKEDAQMALMIVKANYVKVIDLISDRNPGNIRTPMKHLDLFATHLLQRPGPASAPPTTNHLCRFKFLRTLAIDLRGVNQAHDAIQHTLRIPGLETLILRGLWAPGSVHDDRVKEQQSSVKSFILQRSSLDTEALWQLIGSFKQLSMLDVGTRQYELREQYGRRLRLDLALLTKRLQDCHGSTLQTLRLRTWRDGTSPINSLSGFQHLSEIMIQQNMLGTGNLADHIPKSVQKLYILHGDNRRYNLVNLVNDPEKLPSMLLRPVTENSPFPKLSEVNVGWPNVHLGIDKQGDTNAYTKLKKDFADEMKVDLNLVDGRK